MSSFLLLDETRRDAQLQEAQLSLTVHAHNLRHLYNLESLGLALHRWVGLHYFHDLQIPSPEGGA